jgi:ABC-type transport system substrate-binding protein
VAWNFKLADLRAFSAAEIGSAASNWKGGNYSGYVNPRYERGLIDVRSTLDRATFERGTAHLLGLLAEDLPTLPLTFTSLCLVVAKRVEGPTASAPEQPATAWNIHTWRVSE